MKHKHYKLNSNKPEQENFPMKKTFATFYAALMVSYVLLVGATALVNSSRHVVQAPHLPSAVASLR
jgi:hypothetical protein